MNALGIYIFIAIGIGVMIIATSNNNEQSIVMNIFLIIGLLLGTLTTYSIE
jgi:fluoride ion exporter CrcB/FEX